MNVCQSASLLLEGQGLLGTFRDTTNSWGGWLLTGLEILMLG